MKRSSMITHSLLVLAGLACLYFARKHYQTTQALIASGVITTATMIENIVEVDDDTDMYRPKFQYYNRNQQPVEFISQRSNSRPAWRVGETAPMIYLPDKVKSERLISYWNLYRGTILWTALAAPFLVMGMGYFLFHLYNRNTLHPF